jgi:hypothetical protein
MQDENHLYHRITAYVYAKRWVLEHRSLWDGVEAAECIGIELGQIGRARPLWLHWHFATSPPCALIDEASRG